jgi:hypothetical protein
MGLALKKPLKIDRCEKESIELGSAGRSFVQNPDIFTS